MTCTPISKDEHRQCSAQPPSQGRWISEAKRERGFRPELCQHTATFEIDGQPYCAKHAGSMALQILLEKAA